VPIRFRIVLLLFALLAAGTPFADGGLLADGHLDTAAVRDAYLRSDMPFVRAALEGFIKNHPKDVRTAEKVFTHLYLGASYAGEADGRARSEAHFRAALKLDPVADPSDLYLPPAVKEGFEGLRAEARGAQALATATPPVPAEPGPAAPSPPAGHVEPPLPTAPHPPEDTFTSVARRLPAPAPDAAVAGNRPASAPEGSLSAAPARRTWLWWTLGSAAAAAAAGAGALAYVQAHEAPPPHRVQVDATLK
jgi:hypothetical protein